MARFKNSAWNLRGSDTDTHVDGSIINLALLMDIRDELQRLNGLLSCSNFTRIPVTLRAIEANTRRKRRTMKRRP